MICITNTLPNKLEVYIDNDTHELRSGETMVLAPSKTAFKCQVKINCESNIKIAWLALWTGVFTGEQIKPKSICNSEFTFEGIDGEITFYRSTSRPANEICFIGADCVCEGVECKDKKYSIKNKVAFLLKFLFVTLGITSCVPIGLLGLWLAYDDDGMDIILALSSIGVMLLGLPSTLRIIIKMMYYYKDIMADYYMNLPIKQRHDYDQIELELEKGDFTEKKGIIKIIIKKIVNRMIE